MVMFIISLAVVPLVQMMGGPTSADGNAAQITGTKNREALLANTMINKVLAGDYSNFKCSGSGSPLAFNPQSELPTGTLVVNFGRCQSTNGNTPLYYEWNVLNLSASNNNRELPSQNQYFQATFRVTDKDRKDLMVMPVNFFYNFGQATKTTSKTGIMFSLDVSGSMAWVGNEMRPVVRKQFASPYMFYKYDKSLFTGDKWNLPTQNYYVALSPTNYPTGVITRGYKTLGWNDSSFSPSSVPTSPRTILNMWNDEELDLVYGKSIKSGGGNPDESDPDFSTAFNEKFPYGHPSLNLPMWGDGLLGSGDCSRPTNSAAWDNDPYLKHTFLPDARKNIEYKSQWSFAYNYDMKAVIQKLCAAKNSETEWSNTVNQELSRLEASRTAAVSLLLNLEAIPNVVSNVDIGFIPWATAIKYNHLIKPEKSINQAGGLHYVQMRNKLLWINRADPSDSNSPRPVVPAVDEGTNMSGGIDAARAELQDNSTYDRKIIILLTDGAPNGGLSAAQLPTWINSSFGNAAPKNKQITMFTVGLIGADGNLMQKMAAATPDGQAYVAKDIKSLKPIFDAVSYQIQRLALLSTADRYGLSF